ncbi:hypothetical protein AB1Y20_000159 [Prymnesium parvum]|uniref:Uncharacterized protein n=1 Tax=Prymnesium parvum TaxID=97485 RepID=A0AB34K8K4_PRYPA
MLAGGCVLAVSRKQDCVTTSTAHAEIVSASGLSSDIVHARLFCDDLGIPQDKATVLDVDNKAVFDVSRNYTATKNLRHLDRRAFRVRELSFSETLVVRLVASVDNCADVLTKPLDRQPFYKFRRVLLNVVDAATHFLRVFGVFRLQTSLN